MKDNDVNRVVKDKEGLLEEGKILTSEVGELQRRLKESENNYKTTKDKYEVVKKQLDETSEKYSKLTEDYEDLTEKHKQTVVKLEKHALLESQLLNLQTAVTQISESFDVEKDLLVSKCTEYKKK
eukprot:UN34521